jgi:hypothetical protein
MTKFETKEVMKAITYGSTIGADYTARALSALYRAARTQKSKDEIMDAAIKANVFRHAEFII